MEIFLEACSQLTHLFSISPSSTYHPHQCIQPCTNHKKGDPLLFNFNLRSISNQQHYIGNHQNLPKEKKANFQSLYISVWDPLIDWCVNTGLQQQQQQQHVRPKQTVFVYEDQVFSTADGSQRGSVSH